MKRYTDLSINESMKLATSATERFSLYAHNRLKELSESKEYNADIRGLFENNMSQEQFITNFMNENKTLDYEGLVNKFNRLTESKFDRDHRLCEQISSWRISIEDNPKDLISHMQLKESIQYNPERTVKELITEGLQLLRLMDINHQLVESNFSLVDTGNPKLKVNDDPHHVLGLTESVGRAVQYAMMVNHGQISEQLKPQIKAFFESLNNIYSVYKEGIELVETNESTAIEAFFGLLIAPQLSINYSSGRLIANLRDPMVFVQYGLKYLLTWVGKHQMRLQYKFPHENFIRINQLYNIFQSNSSINISDEFEARFKDERYYSFEKLYQVLDVLLEISQVLRMDIRSLVTKYINLVRPLVDSYRTDYVRSRTRAGF